MLRFTTRPLKLCYFDTYNCKYVHTATEDVKPYNLIPGLSGLPFIGSLHHFLPLIGSVGVQKNFYDLSKILYEKFGSIVKVGGMFGRADIVVLFEPNHFDQVYRSEDITPSRPGFETLTYYRTKLRKLTFGGVYGLTTAEGAQWRDFRTKVNPIFLKPKLVKLYAPTLTEIAEDSVSRFLKLTDDPLNVNKNFESELTKWSLESVAYVGLGDRIGCLRDDLSTDDPANILIQSAKNMLHLIWKTEFTPSPWKYISTPNYRKVMKNFDMQWEASAKFIGDAKRRISERGHDIPDTDKSIIEKLLAVDDRVALMMANEMLMAGIDTVAYEVTGILYNLAVNSEVQDKLRSEINSAQANNRYLKACIKESLRLYPVISANLRRSTKDHVVAGYHIPKGIDVISPNDFLSRMEKNYPQPTKFIPDRWVVDKTDPLYHGNAHPMITQPFGFGVRSCIGRRIAELEMEIFIHQFIKEIKVTWTGPPIEVRSRLLNSFEKPFYFKFEKIN